MAHQYECSNAGCEFLIRSQSEDEVARLVRAHVREVHGGRIAPVDLERGIDRIEIA